MCLCGRGALIAGLVDVRLLHATTQGSRMTPQRCARVGALSIDAGVTPIGWQFCQRKLRSVGGLCRSAGQLLKLSERHYEASRRTFLQWFRGYCCAAGLAAPRTHALASTPAVVVCDAALREQALARGSSASRLQQRTINHVVDRFVTLTVCPRSIVGYELAPHRMGMVEVLAILVGKKP
jgi:hypothetical protein